MDAIESCDTLCSHCTVDLFFRIWFSVSTHVCSVLRIPTSWHTNFAKYTWPRLYSHMYMCIVDMQMMCHPNDLISLTFFLWELYGEIWGTPFSHVPCKFQLHHSLASTWFKDVFVIIVGDNWENTYMYVYIYTLNADITYIYGYEDVYGIHVGDQSTHHFPMWKILCLFPRLIHPLLTYTTSGCRGLESQKLLIKLWFSPIIHGNTIHEATVPCPQMFRLEKMHVCSVYFRWPGTQDIASLWGWLKVVEPSSPLSRCSCRSFRKQLVSHEKQKRN